MILPNLVLLFHSLLLKILAELKCRIWCTFLFFGKQQGGGNMRCAYLRIFAHILRIFSIFGNLRIFAHICAYFAHILGFWKKFAHIFLYVWPCGQGSARIFQSRFYQKGDPKNHQNEIWSNFLNKDIFVISIIC